MSDLEGAPIQDISAATTRIQEIAVLLLGADMAVPANQELRREAYALLDQFESGDARKEMLYTAACLAIVNLQKSARQKSTDTDDILEPTTQPPEGAPGPVFIDFGAMEKQLGRKPSDDEADAIALRADALACGRSIEMTVAACEVFGGQVKDQVKRLLGIL